MNLNLDLEISIKTFSQLIRNNQSKVLVGGKNFVKLIYINFRKTICDIKEKLVLKCTDCEINTLIWKKFQISFILFQKFASPLCLVGHRFPCLCY